MKNPLSCHVFVMITWCWARGAGGTGGRWRACWGRARAWGGGRSRTPPPPPHPTRTSPPKRPSISTSSAGWCGAIRLWLIVRFEVFKRVVFYDIMTIPTRSNHARAHFILGFFQMFLFFINWFFTTTNTPNPWVGKRFSDFTRNDLIAGGKWVVSVFTYHKINNNLFKIE